MSTKLKKVLVFNPLKKIMIRGISVYTQEFESLFKQHGVKVVVYELPLWFGKLPKVLQVLGFMFSQQILLPLKALKEKPDMIFDAYNTYSVLAALKYNYIFVIHDFIPFKSKRWYFKPGAVYQKILHKNAKKFTKLRLCYINDRIQSDVDAIIDKSSSILPNIVLPLNDTKVSNAKIENFFNDCCKRNGKFIVTISGAGQNKDFQGLLTRLDKLDMPINLLAFGFPKQFQQNLNQVEIYSPGVVDSAVIATFIASADLFIFHSCLEGFGRPIVEALGLKSKVLCSDVSPSLDYINENYMKNVFIYTLSDFNEFICQFHLAIAAPKEILLDENILRYTNDDLFEVICQTIGRN